MRQIALALRDQADYKLPYLDVYPTTKAPETYALDTTVRRVEQK
jgi:hypothetical protein